MTEPGAPLTPGTDLPRHGGGVRHGKREPSRPPTVLGVLGEVLVTAGVVVLLYLGWQVWWNSWILSAQQTQAATSQSEKWIADAKSHQPQQATPPATATTPPATPAPPNYGPPPVMKPVGFAQPFAVLYIPRLGADYKRVIKQSVDEVQVLNDMSSGIGHYEKTQMPGALGNFAIAGHDTGWGNAFIDIGKLRIGDPIYIQTKDGYYTYQFRNFEFVQPSAVSVIAAVPRHPDAAPQDRLLTITTCNPHYHGAERLIAYAVFETWQPLTAGPPAAIAAIAQKGTG